MGDSEFRFWILNQIPDTNHHSRIQVPAPKLVSRWKPSLKSQRGTSFSCIHYNHINNLKALLILRHPAWGENVKMADSLRLLWAWSRTRTGRSREIPSRILSSPSFNRRPFLNTGTKAYGLSIALKKGSGVKLWLELRPAAKRLAQIFTHVSRIPPGNIMEV